MCIACAQRTPGDLLARYQSHMDGASPSAANPGDPFWRGFGLVSETTDAATGTGTTYTLAVGQTASGVLNASSDVDAYAIQLVAGQTYEFRLLGSGSSFLTDPYLRLLNSSGTTIAQDDDGFTSDTPTQNLTIHERDSRIVFTATTTGTYYLQADNFANETGGYLLTATVHNPTGMIFTVDEIAWQLVNNGNAFFGSPEAASFDVGVDGALSVNISGLTTQGQYLAQQALLAWTLVTGINFTITTGSAEITFDDNASGAFAQTFTSGTTITSATVNVGTDWLATFGTTLASYSFETYIHEIGHALGLAHGGNYNGSAIYGTDNYYLNDSLAWSIMSYMNAFNDEFDFGNPGDVNEYVGASFRYIFTPQIADIIAIQYLYGGYSSAFTGNTTWGFNSNTGVTAIDNAVLSGSLMAMTVYDSGGVDTLDFSGGSSYQIITLYAESLSSVLGGSHNLGIGRGVIIENAIGGSGADDIHGNDVGNVISGRGGADFLYGNGGNDNLNGGLGADFLNGGAGYDLARYDNATTAVYARLDGVAGAFGEAVGDTFISIEGLVGSNFNDTLVGSNSATGDYLHGLGGADQLYGLNGNDTLVGFSGADTLYGGAGNDSLDGGTENDNLHGGLGSDTHIGGTGFDLAWYSGATSGVHVRLDGVVFATGEAVGDTFSSIEGFVGSVHNDILVGSNTVGEYLNGNAGNDTLYGLGGADTLVGGAGNDTLYGGAAADRFEFNTALNAATNVDAIMDFQAGVDDIVLSQAIFAGIGATLDASEFQIGAANAPTDRIIYNSATGQLFYDSNGDGAGGATLFATVTAGTALTIGDFIMTA